MTAGVCLSPSQSTVLPLLLFSSIKVLTIFNVRCRHLHVFLSVYYTYRLLSYEMKPKFWFQLFSFNISQQQCLSVSSEHERLKYSQWVFYPERPTESKIQSAPFPSRFVTLCNYCDEHEVTHSPVNTIVTSNSKPVIIDIIKFVLLGNLCMTQDWHRSLENDITCIYTDNNISDCVLTINRKKSIIKIDYKYRHNRMQSDALQFS